MKAETTEKWLPVFEALTSKVRIKIIQDRIILNTKRQSRCLISRETVSIVYLSHYCHEIWLQEQPAPCIH